MDATQIGTLTHRQTVAVIRGMYPGGCGFDYKRAALATLHTFLAQAAASYPQHFAAACAVLAAPPAPPVPMPAPVAPVPAPVMPAPVMHTPHAAVPIAAPVAAPAPVAPVAPVASPAPSPEPEPAPVAAPVAPSPAPVAPDAVPAALAPLVLAPAAPVPFAMVTAADAFPGARWPDGFAADSIMLPRYAHADAPAVDPHYVWNPHALMVACIAMSQAAPIPFWCYGEKGTGKTAFVEQIAARLGRAFFRIQCDRNLERAEFIGAMGLRNASTQWTDGTLLIAARTAGAVILFDEPTYLQQANVSVLNGFLEPGRAFRIADTGERVAFAPHVIFAAADNTNGTGDESGRYVGTQEMNPATLERFGFYLPFDYLTAAQESKVLHARTGAPRAQCDAIAAVMRATRAKAESGHLPDAPSIRRASAFLVACMAGVRPQDAFEAAVVAAGAPEAREELRAIFAATWKADAPATAPAPSNFV